MRSQKTTERVLFDNIGTLYVNNDVLPGRKEDLANVEVVKDAWMVVRNGLIEDFGGKARKPAFMKGTDVIDVKNMIMTPGLIDSHTHLVHGGSREHEHARLVSGTPYLDILKEGGGILSTVKATRQATFSELYTKALKSLDRMMAYGVTTLEAKSGYGLDFDTEHKMLMVTRALAKYHPMTLLSTYMGAHAVPSEMRGNTEGYVDSVIRDLDKIKAERLADAVDVFCEEGVFSLEATERILTRAKELGFRIRLHADEIVPMGGAGLGARLGASSVDHLLAISDDDIRLLAQSDTVANLLPGTAFYLGKDYARAREMIDLGVAVSVSGDYNPGSNPTENFQFVMHLAQAKMGMTPYEVLNAVTGNAAWHLGVSESRGLIRPGMAADLVIFDAPNLEYMFYHYGINHVRHVIKDGHPVV